MTKIMWRYKPELYTMSGYLQIYKFQYRRFYFQRVDGAAHHICVKPSTCLQLGRECNPYHLIIFCTFD